MTQDQKKRSPNGSLKEQLIYLAEQIHYIQTLSKNTAQKLAASKERIKKVVKDQDCAKAKIPAVEKKLDKELAVSSQAIWHPEVPSNFF